jgi:alkaline phosphatase
MTEKAISLLTQGGSSRSVTTGFFLMVEGSQIDTASHNNDVNAMVRNLVAFDQAVRRGLDFARRDGHTLVVVTADHETGGVEIVAAKAKVKVTTNDPNTTAGAAEKAGAADSASSMSTADSTDDEDEDDRDQDPNAMVLNLKWTGKDHTGMPVPVYAYGPGCLEFSGVVDNTEIPQRIARLLGIPRFPRELGR